MLFNTQKLISRIEELEDLVVELRTTNSAQQVIDLKNCINAQAIEINSLKEKLFEVMKRKHHVSDLFEKNELYISFQKLLNEKDEIIN